MAVAVVQRVEREQAAGLAGQRQRRGCRGRRRTGCRWRCRWERAGCSRRSRRTGRCRPALCSSETGCRVRSVANHCCRGSVAPAAALILRRSQIVLAIPVAVRAAHAPFQRNSRRAVMGRRLAARFSMLRRRRVMGMPFDALRSCERHSAEQRLRPATSGLRTARAVAVEVGGGLGLADVVGRRSRWRGTSGSSPSCSPAICPLIRRRFT